MISSPSQVFPNEELQTLVWSKKLKGLDPTQRLYAEKAINDILFEAELGNLSRYSVRINDPIKPLYTTTSSD